MLPSLPPPPRSPMLGVQFPVIKGFPFPSAGLCVIKVGAVNDKKVCQEASADIHHHGHDGGGTSGTERVSPQICTRSQGEDVFTVLEIGEAINSNLPCRVVP